MSQAFDFDMAALEGDFEDVSLQDPEEYQDQTDPAPVAPGNYRLRILEAKRRVDAEGEPIDDNGYPQFQVNKAVIVEPEEFKDKEVFPFKTYSLKPRDRGQRKGTVPAIDLLRGFDDSATAANGREVLQLLAENIEQGKTLVVGSNWLGKDSDYIKEQIEAAGGDLSALDEKERNDIFNKAIFRGQKKFPKVNGTYLPVVEGPSGSEVQARFDITRIYPSSKTVRKMGPFKPVAKQ